MGEKNGRGRERRSRNGTRKKGPGIKLGKRGTSENVLVQRMVLDDNQKIGVGLITLGLGLIVVGVIMFLDSK